MLLRKKPPHSDFGRARRAVNIDKASTPVFSYHARSARSATARKRRASKLLWTNPTPAKSRLSQSRLPKRALGLVGGIIAGALLLNSVMLTSEPQIVTLAESSSGQAFLRDEAVYAQAARKL